MESVIKDSIISHLESNCLLTDSQHGFRSGRSTVTGLLQYWDKITTANEQGCPYDAVMTDFRRAFDRVQFKKCLQKLKSHGVKGRVLDWIGDWMSGRKQRVVINGEASEWIEVLSSVVQGSVLGPVLFLIFINDLDISIKQQDINTSIFKFADDSKLGRVVCSGEDAAAFQSAIDALVVWCRDWGMELHPGKCKVLHFGHNNQHFNYHIEGNTVETVSEERDLGVIMSTDFKSSSHIRSITRKANAVLGQMKRTVTYRDKTIFPQIYKTYIRPILESAVPVWNTTKREDIKLLESVQRRALKCVGGLFDKPYEERLAVCGMTTLEHRRARIDLTETYRILNGEAVQGLFQHAKERHCRITRSVENDSLVVQRCRTNVRRNFFSNRVVNSWNTLPLEVRNAPSIGAFKRKFDRFVNSNANIQM